MDRTSPAAIIVLWGWRRLRRCAPRRRAVGAGLGAVRLLPDPLADRAGLRLADRRRRSRRKSSGLIRRLAAGRRRRLGLRLRLLPRRPVVDRRGLSRRCRRVRLADAASRSSLLPAGLALFWGFGAALRAPVWPEGWPRILVFAGAMAIAEWLRGHLCTGFPWNAFGYALTPAPLMMQSASVVGLWGLTLVALHRLCRARRCSPARQVVAARPRVSSPLRGAPSRPHLGYGALRLAGASDATVAGVTLRIVQPSIEQDEKWQSANDDEIVRRYLELSDAASSPERTGVGVGPPAHLAGIGVPVPPHRAPRAPVGARRAPAGGHDAHHRRRARRAARRHRAAARVQQRLRHRRRRRDRRRLRQGPSRSVRRVPALPRLLRRARHAAA